MTPAEENVAVPAVPLLEARGLVKEYSTATGAARVVDDVSLTLLRGETLGIVGESGSGKSTVARMLLRLIEPTSGSVRLHLRQSCGAMKTYELMDVPPREMRRLRRSMAIVFQDPYAALDPRMTVRQILTEPFSIHRETPQGPAAPKENLAARLTELLREVGLDDAALRRYPHQFSGGQRQRINIARALALRPELLVLDEPVSALDVSVGAQVINLLRDLQQRYALTTVFISHSMPLVRYLSDRIAVMQRGRIVEQGTWQQICEAPQEIYTQQLLAATPELHVANQ